MKGWQVSVSKCGALESLFPTYTQGCCFGQLAAMSLIATCKQNPICFCSSGILLVLGKRLPSASCHVSCHIFKGIWNSVDWWGTLWKSVGFSCTKNFFRLLYWFQKHLDSHTGWLKWQDGPWELWAGIILILILLSGHHMSVRAILV